MIDLSNLKAAGWQRVVADLSAPAPDDKAFLARLLGVLGQVAGARQAALMVIEPARSAGDSPDAPAAAPEPRAVLTWPQPAPVESGEPVLERAADARSAARGAAESGQVRAYSLDSPKDEAFYDAASAQGYIVAVPVPLTGSTPEAAAVSARAVVTLLLDPRSKQALQTTMALVEVLAGYAHAHATRLQLRRSRSASAALDLAGRLIASVNQAEGFRGAAIQVCNDLARAIKVDRVAFGWVRGVGGSGSGAVRVVAVSDTEHIDRRTAMIQKIEAAMDECLDQDQPVLFPPPPETGESGDVVLAQAITHAHRELVAGDSRLRAASIPLRAEERGETGVVGVVIVEASVPAEAPPNAVGIDPATIELLQATMDLLAPVLKIRRSDDRILPLRAWDSTMRASAWAVGTRHTAWKLAGVLVMVAAILATVVKVPYRFEAPAELQPRTKQTISIPFDGVISALGPGIEPGSRVAKGDVLLELDTAELRLSALSAQAQIVQAEKEADAARASGKFNDAQQAEARAEQAKAKLAQAQERIRQSRMTAPFDGTVIAGDLRDRLGAAVKTGDAVLQVANLADMIVVAKVGDRDIALVEAEGTGYLVTKAYPNAKFPMTVERVVPLARAEEGKNAFEVRSRLGNAAGWMRPGMEGFAKFDAGDHSLVWIGGRRVLDQLRLWLWW